MALVQTELTAIRAAVFRDTRVRNARSKSTNAIRSRANTEPRAMTVLTDTRASVRRATQASIVRLT